MITPEEALHLVMAELDPGGTLATAVNAMQIENLDFEPTCESQLHEPEDDAPQATCFQTGTCDCLTGLRCDECANNNIEVWDYPCRWCDVGTVTAITPLKAT